jgi:hypothetical protein
MQEERDSVIRALMITQIRLIAKDLPSMRMCVLLLIVACAPSTVFPKSHPPAIPQRTRPIHAWKLRAVLSSRLHILFRSSFRTIHYSLNWRSSCARSPGHPIGPRSLESTAPVGFDGARSIVVSDPPPSTIDASDIASWLFANFSKGNAGRFTDVYLVFYPSTTTVIDALPIAPMQQVLAAAGHRRMETRARRTAAARMPQGLRMPSPLPMRRRTWMRPRRIRG